MQCISQMYKQQLIQFSLSNIQSRFVQFIQKNFTLSLQFITKYLSLKQPVQIYYFILITIALLSISHINTLTHIRMLSQSQQMCLKLQRLTQIDKHMPFTHEILLGYLADSLLVINQQTSNQLVLLIKMIFTALQENKFLTRQRFLELVVVLKNQLSNPEIINDLGISIFYLDTCAMMQKNIFYLKNTYFTKPQPKVQKIQLQSQPKKGGPLSLSQMIKINYQQKIQKDKQLYYKNGRPISQLRKMEQKGKLDLEKFNKFIKEQQQESKQTQPQQIGVECPICIVEINHSQICILSCSHMFHKKCFELYMQQTISNKNFPLKCAVEQCGAQVQTADIQEYLPKAIVDKYYEFTFHNFVDKNKKAMSWCPSPGCSSVFEFDQALTNYKCPSCKKNYCLACKCQMHVGLTCQMYKSMNNLPQEDKQFIQFAKGAQFRQCPECKFWVQRNKGCHHMTCRCSFQFCFKCGLPHGNCDCQEKYDDYYGSEEDDDDYDEGEENLSFEQDYYDPGQQQNHEDDEQNDNDSRHSNNGDDKSNRSN